jgi:hypothetical protein
MKEKNKKISKYTRRLIPLALAMAIIFLPTAFAEEKKGIWIIGEGKVEVSPDIAILSLGVEVQGKTVEQAQQKASNAMEKIIGVLKSGGIAAKDIQTTRYRIDSITREGKVTGYEATNLVKVKIRDIDRVGEILDRVVSAGRDLVRVKGINFTIDDPTPYKSQAREIAMSEAKAKARELSQLAGVRLGKVIYIQEISPTWYGRWYGPEVLESRIEAPPMPPPIEPGELEITLTLEVGFSIT